MGTTSYQTIIAPFPSPLLHYPFDIRVHQAVNSTQNPASELQHGVAPVLLQQAGNAHLQTHQAVTKPPKPESPADRNFFQSTKAHVPTAIYMCCKLTNHSQPVTHTGATLSSCTNKHQCPQLQLPSSGIWQWSLTIIESSVLSCSLK